MGGVSQRLSDGKRNFFVAPAVATAAAGAQGGVGLATFSSIGHEAPTTLPTSIVVGGRAIFRHLRGFVPGGLLVGCIYMPLRHRKPNRDECDAVLREMGNFLASVKRPFVVVGDWNATPGDLGNRGLPSRLQATAVCGDERTCATNAPTGLVVRCLGYVLVSDVLVP